MTSSKIEAGDRAASGAPTVSHARIRTALRSAHPNLEDFTVLCSREAEPFLEEMAAKARELTVRFFGRAVILYTPLYLSDHCNNACLYCGFRSTNRLDRTVLSMKEVEAEGRLIAAEGFSYLLLLTGESQTRAPVPFLKSCIELFRSQFTSISLEVFALAESEYAELVQAGADGLVIYQETYDRALYATLHPSGPKSDFNWRLDAPERAARAGMRTVTLGVLLGLSDWRREAVRLAEHIQRLQASFPGVEIGVALPRLRSSRGEFKAPQPVSDRHLVQMLCALRLLLPRSAISISTRESSAMRDALIPLGVTQMSAASRTAVGARTVKATEQAVGQFEIADKRSLAEMMKALRQAGYLPILKDWIGHEPRVPPA